MLCEKKRRRTSANPRLSFWTLCGTSPTFDLDHQKEMTQNPAFLRNKIDTRSLYNVVAALTAKVDVAAFSRVDEQRLVAFVQSRQSSDDDDGELSALSVASYKRHSSVVVEVLNDLLDRAQTELDDTRHGVQRCSHFRDARAVS